MHEGAEACGGRRGGAFKKKYKFRKHNNNYVDDILGGVGFKTGNEAICQNNQETRSVCKCISRMGPM